MTCWSSDCAAVNVTLQSNGAVNNRQGGGSGKFHYKDTRCVIVRTLSMRNNCQPSTVCNTLFQLQLVQKNRKET